MVARLTPDQKVACSIHVGFKTPIQQESLFSPLWLFFFSITTSKRPTAQPIRNKPAQGLPLAPPNLNPHHASRSFLSPSPTPSLLSLSPSASARTFPTSEPTNLRAAAMATVMQKIKDIEDEVNY